MAQCVVCGRPAQYFEWSLKGMACGEHAEDGTQVGTVRSLAAALLKSLASDGVLDPGRFPETSLIVERLRPFLND